MKRLILLFIILIAGQYLMAQQYPLFSNYLTNRFGFNPAVAGVNPFMEARFVYRKQWVGLDQSPETQVLSLYGRPKAKKIGFGGTLYNDVAGALKRTGAGLSIAYHLKIADNSFVSGGITGGYYNIRATDEYRAKENSDAVILSAQNGVWVPDFNFGVHLQMKDFYIGFAIPQVLDKDLGFSANDIVVSSYLEKHYYAMAGYDFQLNDKLRLEPSVLFKFVKDAPTQLDFSLRAHILNTFWVGGSYRTDDAFAAMVGVDLKNNLSLAYAFDLTHSSLNKYNNGSHEITIGYRFDRRMDSDNDGIADEDDNCPNYAGPKTSNGCPDKDEEEALAEEDKKDPKEKKEKKPKKEDEAIAALEDSDNDGVPDVEDDCPLEVGLKIYGGCLYGDKDKDGIKDSEDNCPEIAGITSNDGCPIDDRDKDGIVDNIDKCPDLPGVMAGDGCPIEDRDQDGIADDADRCPDIKGLRTAWGCPDNDSDFDGIVDELDPCPNTRGIDGSGCPRVTEAHKEVLQLAIRNLYFDTDKDEIWPESKRYLDNLSVLLSRKRDWKVKMTGHADYRGTDNHNDDLSKRRVESVLYYMMNRGVSREQLITEYYGEENPAREVKNSPGLQLNRRVEMEFVFN